MVVGNRRRKIYGLNILLDGFHQPIAAVGQVARLINRRADGAATGLEQLVILLPRSISERFARQEINGREFIIGNDIEQELYIGRIGHWCRRL